LKRSAHILLALLVGILLQTSLFAFSSDTEHSAAAKLGFPLADPGDAGALLDPDLPDAPQPHLNGPSPQPFALTSAPTAVLPRVVAVLGPSSAQHSPAFERPIYLTTQRLRL